MIITIFWIIQDPYMSSSLKAKIIYVFTAKNSSEFLSNAYKSVLLINFKLKIIWAMNCNSTNLPLSVIH